MNPIIKKVLGEAALEQMLPMARRDRMVQRVQQLAQELVQMHGA